MLKFIPEYNAVKQLFIVSPYKVRKGDCFFEEFSNIIEKIEETFEDELEIIIICVDCESISYTENYIKNKNFNKENIKISFKEVIISDIWIRDFFLIGNSIEEETKEKLLLKATYHPSYNQYYAPIDDAAGYNLCEMFSEDYRILPIKLDGGNVITNDEFIICSEKLFTENIDLYSKREIEEYFSKIFKQKLITLPVENLDVVGHSDCMVRFLTKDIILLPMFPANFRTDNRYTILLKNKLRKEIGMNYRIEFLPSYLTEELNEDNIFSAEGCYLNYLRLNNHIYFPSFKNDEYYQKEVKNKIKKLVPDLEVHFIKIDNIALEGGCLNCVTNVIYK